MDYKPNMEKMVDFKYLKPYFENKNVLVTGHTGFKGSWLIQILARMGARICGIALEATNQLDLYNQIDGEYLCTKSVIMDIRDAKAVKQNILGFEPDFIFHLAAQPLVIESYQNPLYTFETNTIGTANILDALQHVSNKCICICITTDKVYDNPETGVAFLESDKLGGYDPYSASKAAAEIIIDSYRRSIFAPENFEKHKKVIASVRAGNVIGGGDYAANRLIPDIVKAIENNTIIELRNPNATRPWQHVIEPLGAYLLLATKMWDNNIGFAESFNIGPNEADVISVKAIVEKAIQMYGKGEWQDISNPNQLHEAQNLVLDINKAKNKLDWTPKLTVDDCITETIEWYKSNLPADVKCLQFINIYFNNFINDATDNH
jgi:CDP-glucose 4,6-dehydratase